MGIHHHAARVLIAAGLAVVPFAAVAHAAEPTNVWVENGVLRVQSPVGQNNTVTLTPNGGLVEVTSPNGLASFGQCQPVAADRVVCSGTFASFQLETKDGNDTIRNNTALPGKVFAATGNDTVTDGPGNQTVDLGPGTDVSVVGTGVDTIIGGTGVDAASYQPRTATVHVTLDTLANDGQPGEGDTIRTDVENVTGGSGSDRLIGSAANNILSGREGNDTLTGNAGNDTANGSTGTDTCSAEVRISCP